MTAPMVLLPRQRIVDVLRSSKKELSLKQIVTRSQVHMVSCGRILHRLMEQQLLTRRLVGKKYLYRWAEDMPVDHPKTKDTDPKAENPLEVPTILPPNFHKRVLHACQRAVDAEFGRGVRVRRVYCSLSLEVTSDQG